MPENTETTPVTTPPETKPLTEREQAYQRMGYGTQPTETPKVEAPPETPPAPNFEEILSRATGPLIEKITALEQKLTPPVKEEPKVNIDDEMIQLLRDGDMKGFREALTKAVEAGVTQRVTEQAKDESLAEFQIRQTLNDFLNGVRTTNSDIIEEEPWITSIAAVKLQAAKDAGKIKDSASYIEVYKSSVNEAVAEVRSRIQRYRANGKDEALTTKREVISSSPLTPSGIADRGAQQTPKEPDVSPESYIAQRQRWQNQRKGLTQ